MKGDPLDVRFWSKVEKTNDCWLWKGSRATSYGKLWLNGRDQMAHRFAYSFLVGTIPPGQCVCHRCDEPLCVNPSHLFLGSKKDNSQDAVRKGRLHRNSGGPKLTNRKAEEIRQRHASGESKMSLSKRFGVHWKTIHEVVLGETWAS